MSRPRIRQHVNPLTFRGEVEVPVWEEVFARLDLPREVDVGCAHGDFLLRRASERPDLNLVGLEIRKPMAERVRRKIERAGLGNAAVVVCNANTAWRSLFGPSSLQAVYVHFPDPWFKKKHRKRRIMTPAFVEDIARTLAPGGLLRFMTDHGEYAEEVVDLLARAVAFEEVPDPEGLPATHREEWHAGRGDAIHRAAWRRRP